LTNVNRYEIITSQNKLGDSMKSIKALTAVVLTTLSLVAVAADKPAEKKADKPATTASAPAPAADSKDKPRPKVITPKEKAERAEAKKAEAKPAEAKPEAKK